MLLNLKSFFFVFSLKLKKLLKSLKGCLGAYVVLLSLSINAVARGPSGKTVGFILIFPPPRWRPTAVHKQKEMPAVRLITPSSDICFEHFSSTTPTTLWLLFNIKISRTISYCGTTKKTICLATTNHSTSRHIGAILRNFSTLACQNPLSPTRFSSSR